MATLARKSGPDMMANNGRIRSVARCCQQRRPIKTHSNGATTRASRVIPSKLGALYSGNQLKITNKPAVNTVKATAKPHMLLMSLFINSTAHPIAIGNKCDEGGHVLGLK